jgi:hypothetical protein
MKFAKSQKGMSFAGWLLTLAIIGFVAATAFKIVPHYMDYWAMEKVINSAATDKSQDITSVGEFYSHVSRGMQVNNIRDLDLNSALSVTEEGNMFRAHLKYEKREPLIRNFDLVVKFDREFSVVKP